jgi:hypothetical protein
MMPLADGRYTAACKERTSLSAAMNGHSQIYPSADMTIRDGWAYFYRDGVEVWDCNGAYAEMHFLVERVK